MEAVAEYIQKTSPTKIIVLTGAGISTAAGIPDFRTPGTGLYDNLQQYDLPYAEAIFDIDYFRRKPEPFYALAKALYPGNFTPTLSHYFIRMLADQGILLRQYTQNIDTLERRAGMLDEWLVEAHGSFHEAVCVDCGHVIPSQDADGSDAVREAIFADTIPRCAQCSGIVKPKIVFFGEGLPLTYFSRMNEDFDKCDLLLVMGTSLKVQPFASLIDRVPNHVPRLLINLERCGEVSEGRMSGFDFSGKKHKFQRDAFWSGRCDDGCLELAKLLG
ncbi:DHS-like NAD/FAD-binding domain-containing protein, partial [Piptocephalis cylindrospora]